MDLVAVLEQFPREQTYLIEILLKYQSLKPTQHLNEDELKTVADHLDLPESHVYGVVSFYSFFSMSPRGRYIIQYCRDVPCHINDDFDVKASLEKQLGITTGQTSEDGMFTLEYSSCLGMCDQSPVIRVNDKVYPRVNEKKIKALIAECRSDCDD